MQNYKYQRVIPRDLFNEAKLLKCLGRLVICSEAQANNTVEVRYFDHDDNGFSIQQDPADGTLYSNNISVYVNKARVHVFSNYNSKADWPLNAYVMRSGYAMTDTELVPVFDDAGNLTVDFLKLGCKATDNAA
jgi:hypothetical protein